MKHMYLASMFSTLFYSRNDNYDTLKEADEYAIYARKSTDDPQNKQQESILHQIKTCYNYAHSHHLKLKDRNKKTYYKR